MSGERLMAVRVTQESLALLCQQSPAGRWFRVESGVPADARFLRAGYDARTHTFALVFEHPSFPVTLPGDPVPYGELLLNTMTPGTVAAVAAAGAGAGALTAHRAERSQRDEWFREQVREARAAGRAAGELGQPPGCCPHTSGSRREQWMIGWQEGDAARRRAASE